MSVSNKVEAAMWLVATSLCRGVGVELVFGPMEKPSTDGKSIYMPSIKQNAPRHIVAAWWGVLLHEVGHILFTSFYVNKPKTPFVRAVYRVLEDVRMERRVAGKFPGGQKWLSEAVSGLKELGWFADPEPAKEVKEVFFSFLLYHARSWYMGQDALAEYADAAEANLSGLIGPAAVVRLKALLAQITNLKSTQDSVNLAAEIARFLEEEKAQQEQDQSQSQGQGQDQSQSQGQGQDQSQSQGQGQSQGQDQSQGQIASLLSLTDSEAGKIRLDLMDAQDAANFGTACAPFSDTLTSPKVGEAEAPGADANAIAQSNRMAGAIAQRLSNMLMAQVNTHVTSHRTGVKFHRHWVKRVACANPNLFMRKHDDDGMDTAVFLLVDASGSMGTAKSGSKAIEVAVGTIGALCNALGRVPGCSAAAAVFPAGNAHVKPILNFGEVFTRVSARFALSASGGTPIEAAMMHAISSLHQRDEERKICITITDGICGSEALNRLCNQARALGIELWGIGINADIPHLFPVQERVNAANELGACLGKLFAKALSRAS